MTNPIPDGFPEIISAETARRLLDLVLGIGEVAELVKKLKTMSDYELSGLLVDHVWAYLPGGSPQSKLLDEVIDRLQHGMITETCPECHGSGEDLEDSSKDCYECHGSGVIGKKAGKP